MIQMIQQLITGTITQVCQVIISERLRQALELCEFLDGCRPVTNVRHNWPPAGL